MPKIASLPPTVVRRRLLARLRMVLNFFQRWIRTDINTLAASLAILGGLKGGLGTVSGILTNLRRYISHFFTSSIAVPKDNKLNREVLSWLRAHALEGKQRRSLMAMHPNRSYDPTTLQFNGCIFNRDDWSTSQQLTVMYLPTFDMHYFWFEGTLIMVKHGLDQDISLRSLFLDRSTLASTGEEPLLLTCIGRSVEPIQRFLTECRRFANFTAHGYVKIHTSLLGRDFDMQLLRSPRPLETVHFEQSVKDDLLADIANYLKPETREYYTQRGIPYRRGYLLHGPPGTGKSSLSFALAGAFMLDLLVVDLPSIKSDRDLGMLFSEMPEKCIVLIEDIDAVGLKRKPAASYDDEDEKKTKAEEEAKTNKDKCTLSGLLNVLDGVVAQQGRIVLMTTNHEVELDEALTRPGRIDKKIYLGNIGKELARQMFIRMYAPDHTTALPTASPELLKLAEQFCSTEALDGKFSPAQVQEYLLQHRESPRNAVEGLENYIDEQMRLREKKKKEAENRKKKVTEKAADGKAGGDNVPKVNENRGTTEESDKTDGAAIKSDDNNYDKNDDDKSDGEKSGEKNGSDRTSSDLVELVIVTPETSSGNQTDSSESKDSPVEPQKEGETQ
ncbi:hypothetical protein PG987_016322 [Apiospora arundinis]